MRNGIIIPMLLIKVIFLQGTRRYIFHLMKYEHKGVTKIIDSDD